MFMSFETAYAAHHLKAAQDIFAALNHHATTPGGQYQLAKCNIHGVVIRGSALAAFPDRNPIFQRSINDIDFRTLTTDPNYKIEHIPALLKFMNDAVAGSGYEISMKARDKGRSIADKARAYLYPRIEIMVTSKTDPRLKTEFHLSLYGAYPNSPPLLPLGADPAQKQPFVRAQNPYLQLAEKIRIQHATARVKIKPSINAQKNRRVLDLLDTYQAYHVALAYAGSHEGVVAELKKIFDGPMISQFNIRTHLSIVQHLLVNHQLYSDLQRFDEQHDTRAHINSLVQHMTEQGMIKIFKPELMNPDQIMDIPKKMADVMPLPISRTLVRLARPKILRRLRRKNRNLGL